MKYFLVVLLVAGDLFAYAQLETPNLSPEANSYERVGYTSFHIRYGRPAVRGRKIMGGLVPYKKLWRTGGGRCFMIDFNQPVIIDSKSIPAGAYALVTIPDEKEWTIMLNSDTSKYYGDPSEYDQKSEVVRLKVSSEKSSEFYESLTATIDIVQFDAVFSLQWENTRISFPIKTNSYEKAVANIKAAIEQQPNDPDVLGMASWFYLMTNNDSQQVLNWVDAGLKNGEERWLLNLRVDALEKMGRYKEAHESANRAIQFLRTKKPEGWEDSVLAYEEKIKGWAVK